MRPSPITATRTTLTLLSPLVAMSAAVFVPLDEMTGIGTS
jgi:hypothetical protein